jgi:hypothetical protein
MAARLGIGADGDRARAQRKALLGEDDATTVFETSKEVTVITTFDQMSLKEDLLRGIYAYGRSAGGVFVLDQRGDCVFLFVQVLRGRRPFSNVPSSLWSLAET